MEAGVVALFINDSKGEPHFASLPEEGLEPSPCCQDGILNPARLPIPPLRRVVLLNQHYQIPSVLNVIEGSIIRIRGHHAVQKKTSLVR